MGPYTKKMVVKTFEKKDKTNVGATVKYTESHRCWDTNEAKEFVRYVDNHGMTKGLTYWSARDFLDHHSKNI